MPFGLTNAPQIYQRLIDKALYGFRKIGAHSYTEYSKPSELIDVYTERKPATDPKASVLSRRSYIDDILIHSTSWTTLDEKVKKLLEACGERNLAINLTKRLWARRNSDY